MVFQNRMVPYISLRLAVGSRVPFRVLKPLRCNIRYIVMGAFLLNLNDHPLPPFSVTRFVFPGYLYK